MYNLKIKSRQSKCAVRFSQLLSNVANKPGVNFDTRTSRWISKKRSLLRIVIIKIVHNDPKKRLVYGKNARVRLCVFKFEPRRIEYRQWFRCFRRKSHRVRSIIYVNDITPAFVFEMYLRDILNTRLGTRIVYTKYLLYR